MKFLAAAMCGLLIAGAAPMAGVKAAHAFTYDTHSYQNSDGSARFQDPDRALEESSNSGFSAHLSGGSSSSFGSGSDRLFLPDHAASGPFGGQSGFDTALGSRSRY